MVVLSSLVTRVAPSLMGVRSLAGARNFDAVQQVRHAQVGNLNMFRRMFAMRFVSALACFRCDRLSDAFRLLRRYGP
jgi:hypothetical protein